MEGKFIPLSGCLTLSVAGRREWKAILKVDFFSKFLASTSTRLKQNRRKEKRRRKIDDKTDIRWLSQLSCRSRTFSSLSLSRFMSIVFARVHLIATLCVDDINRKQFHIHLQALP